MASPELPMTEAEVAAIRLSLRRDRPYGTDAWTTETAGCLGLWNTAFEPGADNRGFGLPLPPSVPGATAGGDTLRIRVNAKGFSEVAGLEPATLY